MADTSPKDTIDELKAMVTDYAKQQTVEPLKRLGDWVKFGLAGALFLAMGGFLLGLGVLRLFQTMDWTDNNWSFLPYLIVFALWRLRSMTAGPRQTRHFIEHRRR